MSSVLLLGLQSEIVRKGWNPLNSANFASSLDNLNVVRVPLGSFVVVVVVWRKGGEEGRG